MLAIDTPIASSPTAPESVPAAGVAARSLAHAARHAILQRIAPALRHDMVVPLQALGMTTEAIKARLDRSALRPEDLPDTVSRLHKMSRRAVANCLQVASWMDTTQEHTVALDEGIGEIVDLLTSSLNFRGFQLRNASELPALEVDRRALRFLLVAAIVSLADSAPGPGELVLAAEGASNHAVLSLTWNEGPAPPVPATPPADDLLLAWHEVQALAALESAELRRSAHGMLLRLPRAVVRSPLKIAPV